MIYVFMSYDLKLGANSSKEEDPEKKAARDAFHTKMKDLKWTPAESSSSLKFEAEEDGSKFNNELILDHIKQALKSATDEFAKVFATHKAKVSSGKLPEDIEKNITKDISITYDFSISTTKTCSGKLPPDKETDTVS